MYSQDLIEAVLKHADIVQVISSYIPVTKKGRNYVALCPFHDDSNPSMQINVEKQIFKCFVCQAGGNAIGFVQRIEKIPFGEALRKVAEISGFSDPRLQEEAPKVHIDPETAKLYACINDLQAYYRYSIDTAQGAEARRYLDNRDLGPEIRAKYGIGFSPLDGQTTIKYLQAKGHSLKTIYDIGAVSSINASSADFAAGRVTFPLCDPNGQTIGFSCRRIIQDETGKYVNSPERTLFHKRQTLYNYHNAAKSAHRDGYCYVLEGFMDVIALDRAGIQSAVALMGTAFTKEHASLLKRLRCEVRLCLDGDGPGQAAMMEACGMLNHVGVPYRIVDYGGDLRDPDEILRQEGVDALRDKLTNLVEAVDFQLGYYTHNKKLETPAERQSVLNSFLPVLRTKEPGIEFEDMLAKLAAATGYRPEAIRELLNQTQQQEFNSGGQARTTYRRGQSAIQRRTLSRLETAERTMLQYMLKNREAIDYFEQNVSNFSSSSTLSTISEFVLEYAAQHEGAVNVSELLGVIQASDFENSAELLDAVSDLDADKTLPPYSLGILQDCAQIIAEESLALSEKMAAERAISTGSDTAGAQANKEFAAKIRDRWARKPKKG